MPAGTVPRRAVQAAALLAMLVSFVLQLVGALAPNAPLLIATSAAGLALDLYLQHRDPGLLALLGKVRFDVMVRQLLRDMVIMLGLLRLHGDGSLRDYAPVFVGVVLFYAAHLSCQAVAIVVRRSRTLPFVTRNIDTTGLHLTAAPPRLLARQHGRRLVRFAIPASAGLLFTVGSGKPLGGMIGVGVALLLALGGTLYLTTWLRPAKRVATEEQAIEWLDQWLASYRPTVGMYFSGGTSSAYQANMWLSTLAELDGNPLIVLRERFMVKKIDATDVPIICFPKVVHLMALEKSTLKLLLHPANSGKTSQVLRMPSIKHAFINHGESDKLSSCNPYSKAYDEIWVAGPAARERYQLADIGVDDRDVVEVGRPQLAPIQPYTGAPARPYTTVLYAPTWEGWDGNPGNTSVILAGENIVRELLADPAVRLLYKPHPMTGSVEPRAGEANRRIKEMIREANAQRDGYRPGPEAAAEVERLTVELQELTAKKFPPSVDETERMLLQTAPEPGRSAAVTATLTAWEAAYWSSLPEWEHQIVTGPRPTLFSCFNQADVLISDVSSVVSDYLISEKPYAVANTSGMSEEEFLATFPTVTAATILEPDAASVPALLASVRDPRLDRLAKARAELKVQLLGPSDPPSLVRFNQAALELAHKADERAARAAARAAASPVPGQREDADAPSTADGAPTAPGEQGGWFTPVQGR
ncbi:hypothetical protein GCM10010357_61920 [Streptomyces luteireticuli]|uniref:Integral membrane protein n=2 Tax=Streptomyces luteireticuli TaxID=173858 RepID=A0ABN0Z3R2_9ACTN